ncbi:hypothetical protein KKG48_03245 [Patescibacteria group bacterium]|nr:hypothetical protein [Patescibacteria group bacterium]MCG2694464.1 hypothetical protein [Candidatus Parcubacteria bacterium]
MTIQEFIKKRKYLVWYVKNPEKLNNEAIVEAVLNYGDWDDVQKMIKILGMKKVAKIFKEKTTGKRCNYHMKTKNYFNLFFNKYAKQ